MMKKWSIVLAFLLPVTGVLSQVTPADSTRTDDIPVLDSTINYEELFQDFDAFMDSILSPQSYFLASLSMSNGYYNFEQKTSNEVVVQKKLT